MTERIQSEFETCYSVLFKVVSLTGTFFNLKKRNAIPSLRKKYLQFLFLAFNTFITILVFKAVFALLFLEKPQMSDYNYK